MRSAAHLAEHLEHVPVIVIPTIIGRHDGNGTPGLFDSVIQSAWSFCLALRARGLGTCWTTAILAKDTELKELLGIPDHMTEIVMLPVAWTRGTEFHRAPCHDARVITYVDRFAHTYESGPSDPVRLADGPGTIVEVDIHARPSDVWTNVVDVEFPARFSDELVTAVVGRPGRGPVVGRHVRRTQHPPCSRRVGHSLLRRRLRGATCLRVAHSRRGQPRRPVALRARTDRGRDPPPVPRDARTGAIGHHRGHRAPAGQRSKNHPPPHQRTPCQHDQGGPRNQSSHGVAPALMRFRLIRRSEAGLGPGPPRRVGMMAPTRTDVRVGAIAVHATVRSQARRCGRTASAKRRAGSRMSRPKNSTMNIVQPRSTWRRI